MTTRLAVESDGDRVPKDVYLIDQDGHRVATMDAVHGDQAMFALAREICKAFNEKEEVKAKA